MVVAGPPGPGVLSQSSVALRTGYAFSDLDAAGLWAAQYALGGHLSVHDVRAVLAGRREVDDHEHDLLATAINERLTDMGLVPVVRYSAAVDRAAHHPAAGG